MLERLIAFALQNRLLVLVLFASCCLFGAWRLLNLPIDAFPDTTPVQVQVNTSVSALNPEEIELEITRPIEWAISGLPGLVNVRSVSKFGLSQVVATFDDDTHVFSARQFIMERLATVELAEGIERPQLGPVATGLGEVLHYIVRSTDPNRSLTDVRTLHDTIIKPELLKVPGVAEVNSWGGFEKQYHVIVNPESLVKYGLTLHDVEEALMQNNHNVGGGQIGRAGESLLVHGLGRVASVDEISSIVVAAHEGAPIHIHDVAEVRIDHEIRRGAVTFQGQGEAMLGLGFMLMGENSHDVTQALRERLVSASSALPDDLVVEVVYDRTGLVTEVIETVTDNLVMGAILVVLVLFVLLGNVRAGLLVVATIPVAMLFAVAGMYEMAIAASLLSLGAVDFGILVDGSVVMTEVNLRRLREEQARLGRILTRSERLACVIRSSQEIVRPIAFGMGIILIVFLPVLTLEGVEGKMFKPMAWTFILALLAATAIALVLSPVLSYYFLPRNARPEHKGLSHVLTWAYDLSLRGTLRVRWLVLALTVLLVAGVGVLASRLGAEFTPRLSEGSLVANVIRLAGVSIDTSVRHNTLIEKALLEAFPDEIRYVWSRIGSAEIATDPMGTELTDIFFTLYPREQWKKATSQAGLVAAIEETLAGLPGLNIAYSQPIELRMNELASGIRSDVGIMVYGDSFDELVRISDDIQRTLLQINGAADLSSDQITGQPAVQIRVDQSRLARHGIPGADVLDFVQAAGGVETGQVYEGERSFPLIVRLPDKMRTNVDLLREATIPTALGPQLELHEVADIREVSAPSTINREWGRRLIRVQANVRGRDVASFVKEAQEQVAANVTLPEGYLIEWGGQFQNLERARLRFALIVPLTLLLVFVLLYFSLKSLSDVLIIYTGIPFAAIGGVLALWMRGIPFSVSAAVGFIALSGIAVLNGQVLVAAIRAHVAGGLGLRQALIAAGKERLRPVLATAITDAAGFIPMALSTGVGAEVQRP
ncbi:MAG: efflux RND transporter permease subunit, partial [Candidatus Hydrogenedentes bacterium]|nr:efflux RND transporter permease subunit [Candidatus Hydrogenedentota bacterium]